ncbi:hypothetical protein A8C32_07380 [Flavivirga aquatica]|uniref:Coenzyme Q (Ubiquinone) biosynthesis protein Coq4 n=1 Tax=Flavivirga aquatica TaxID=1849968 RepID=A0A1E5SIQ7_9FLAO|nr:Coq4 family protein [Flavivirga aquatica]OEJ98995.1 hypothetical protein A8C32_07380 [Flavivirga aquatica]
MDYRKQIIKWFFDKSQKIYGIMLRKYIPWEIKKTELLTYPKDSFGKHLGIFLNNNNFELIPKGERHDAYHIITGYGTKVEDEIALQFLCFGNGKRSLYIFGPIILGSIILPEYFKYYYKSYRIGKNANIFHHYDYKKLLKISIEDFRQAIFSKAQIEIIKLQYK